MDNKNYKYSIHINQFACIESGLDLDIIDLAILDYIKDFYCSNKCIKIQTEEGIYFWVSHTKIINDMPLLRIKTKQGLIKRINNLINANVLQKHPNCDVYAKTLYKFGSNYDLLIFNQNSNVDKYQNEFTPLNESLPPPSTFVYPPLNETLGNNSIINNKELNNNNINNMCDISEIEVLEYEEIKKEKSSAKKEKHIEIEIYPTFEDFWDAYDKKVGRKKCEAKWNRLSQKTKEEIMAYIPKYKLSTPDIKYRKNPETFLNNESWNDEIIISTNYGNGKNQFNSNSELAAITQALRDRGVQ